MPDISVVQLLSCVQFFVTAWTAAHQAYLSFTISQSLLKLISIESVISSNHLVLCHPLLIQSFPASRYFLMSQFFTLGGQIIGASASPSVLPMNIQDWFPLGLTGLISLLSKGLSRVFSILICYKDSPSLFSPTPTHSQLFSSLDCGINSHAYNYFSQNLGSSFIFLLSLIYPSANLVGCTSKCYIYKTSLFHYIQPGLRHQHLSLGLIVVTSKYLVHGK